jgi:hypothetical protein
VNNYGIKIAALTVVSLIVSAFSYNVLVNYDFEKYLSEESESNALPPRVFIFVIIIGLVWVSTVAYSLIMLYDLFGSDEIWPEILASTSAIIIFLLLSDLILNYLFDDYNNAESGQ